MASSYKTEKVHDGWEEGVVKVSFIDSDGKQRMHVRHYKIGNGAHDTVMGDCYTPEDCIKWSIRWIQTHEVDTLTDPFLERFPRW